jgi:hypothetical protein
LNNAPDAAGPGRDEHPRLRQRAGPGPAGLGGSGRGTGCGLRQPQADQGPARQATAAQPISRSWSGPSPIATRPAGCDGCTCVLRENIAKRALIHGAAFNLGLKLRVHHGLPKPRSCSAAACALILAVVRPIRSLWAAPRPAGSIHSMLGLTDRLSPTLSAA